MHTRIHTTAFNRTAREAPIGVTPVMRLHFREAVSSCSPTVTSAAGGSLVNWLSGHVATNPVDAGGRSARGRGEPRNQAESPVAWIPTGGCRKVSEGGSGDAARLFGLTRNVPDVIIHYRFVART